MTYGEAYKLMKNGERITRTSWQDPNKYLVFNEGVQRIPSYPSVDLVQGNIQTQWIPELGDTEGTDWVVMMALL